MNGYETSFEHGNGKHGNHLGRDLGEIRREILKLDLEILELLHERLQLAEEAGERKRQEGKQLRDESREEELLRILTGHTENEELVEGVWRQIFDYSLRAQTDEPEQNGEPEAAEEVSLGETPDPDPDRGTSEYWWMREKRTDDWEAVRVDGRNYVHHTTASLDQKLEELPGSTEWSGPIRRPGEVEPAVRTERELEEKKQMLKDVIMRAHDRYEGSGSNALTAHGMDDILYDAVKEIREE